MEPSDPCQTVRCSPRMDPVPAPPSRESSQCWIPGLRDTCDHLGQGQGRVCRWQAGPCDRCWRSSASPPIAAWSTADRPVPSRKESGRVFSRAANGTQGRLEDPDCGVSPGRQIAGRPHTLRTAKLQLMSHAQYEQTAGTTGQRREASPHRSRAQSQPKELPSAGERPARGPRAVFWHTPLRNLHFQQARTR